MATLTKTNRRVGIVLAAYVVLVGSVFTPLYEPFTIGRDDSWAILVLLGCAHLALGFGVARTWVLVLPVVVAVLGFVVNGSEGLAWPILVFGLPHS